MAYRPQTTALTYIIQEQVDKYAPGFKAQCCITNRRGWEVTVAILNPVGFTIMLTETILQGFREAHNTAVELTALWASKAFDNGHLKVQLNPDHEYPKVLKNCATLGHTAANIENHLTCPECKTKVFGYGNL